MMAPDITIDFPGELLPDHSPAARIPSRFLPFLPGLTVQPVRTSEASCLLQTLQGAGISWTYLQLEARSPQTLRLRARRPMLLFAFSVTGTAGFQFKASEPVVTIHAQEQTGIALRKGSCRLWLEKGMQRIHFAAVTGPYAELLTGEFSRFRKLYNFLTDADQGTRQLPPCVFQQEAVDIFNRFQQTGKQHVPLLLYYKENIYKLLKAYHKRLEKRRGDFGNQKLYDQAVRYVRDHLLESDLNPDRVARGIGVTRRTLNHAFEKRLIKISHFIKVLRLLKAQEMLYFTDIPVDEIAAIVGYDSSSYFNKCFAERFFMTPQECRESMR